MRRVRVGLVTPLRDRMQLVAKAFVAAQDPVDPGVLIPSQLAGSATAMARCSSSTRTTATP
jgi:trehalose 6-phosphate synthase